MQTAQEEPLQDTTSLDVKKTIVSRGIWSFVALLLAAFYLARSLYISSHRFLWFDELFTVQVARLPHWTTIWVALAHAVDAQPPIYYMVVRIFDKLFGYSEVAVRLPSSLAMA